MTHNIRFSSAPLEGAQVPPVIHALWLSLFLFIIFDPCLFYIVVLTHNFTILVQISAVTTQRPVTWFRSVESLYLLPLEYSEVYKVLVNQRWIQEVTFSLKYKKKFYFGRDFWVLTLWSNQKPCWDDTRFSDTHPSLPLFLVELSRSGLLCGEQTGPPERHQRVLGLQHRHPTLRHRREGPPENCGRLPEADVTEKEGARAEEAALVERSGAGRQRWAVTDKWLLLLLLLSLLLILLISWSKLM